MTPPSYQLTLTLLTGIPTSPYDMVSFNQRSTSQTDPSIPKQHFRSRRSIPHRRSWVSFPDVESKPSYETDGFAASVLVGFVISGCNARRDQTRAIGIRTKSISDSRTSTSTLPATLHRSNADANRPMCSSSSFLLLPLHQLEQNTYTKLQDDGRKKSGKGKGRTAGIGGGEDMDVDDDDDYANDQ